MGAELELVDVMTAPPAQCLLCACAPVDETKEHKPPLPAVHAVGLDVNWGEDVYLCYTCVSLAADMIGRPDSEKVLKVISQAKFQKKRADKAEKKYEKVKDQLDRIVQGRKAVKEVTEEVAKDA